MPTPTERLEAHKRRPRQCRLCLWLESLDPDYAVQWREAIDNARFSAPIIAAEIAAEVDGSEYTGDLPTDNSVEKHRRGNHE